MWTNENRARYDLLLAAIRMILRRLCIQAWSSRRDSHRSRTDAFNGRANGEAECLRALKIKFTETTG